MLNRKSDIREIVQEVLFRHAVHENVRGNTACRIFNDDKNGVSVKLIQQLCSIQLSKEQLTSRLLKDVYYRDLEGVWLDLFLLNVMKNYPNIGWKRIISVRDAYRLKNTVVNVLLWRMLSDEKASIMMVQSHMPLPMLKKGDLLIIDDEKNGMWELRYRLRSDPMVPKKLYFSGTVAVHMPFTLLHKKIKQRLKERKFIAEEA